MDGSGLTQGLQDDVFQGSNEIGIIVERFGGLKTDAALGSQFSIFDVYFDQCFHVIGNKADRHHEDVGAALSPEYIDGLWR